MNCSVSVIIPVFNDVSLIGQTLQSVLDQTYPPYEIIVINDGSAEGAMDALSIFGPKIKVISISNGGILNARNIGIRASSGELIAFLDADDIWHREKLERQVAAFDAHPDVGFCCCDYSVSHENIGKIINHFSIFENAENIFYDMPLKPDPFEALIKKNFIDSASSVVIRRSVLDMAGLFNVTYRQDEGYDLWLRCALVTDFIILSARLIEKASRHANLTNDYLDRLLCHEQVLIGILDDNDALLRPGTRLQTSRLTLAMLRYQIGSWLFDSGQKVKAFLYFFRGMLAWKSFDNFRLLFYILQKRPRA
jgi:glycosyltransferase involved in cell wall biosynthesis